METVLSRPLTEEEQRILNKHAPPLVLSLWPPIAAGAFFLLVFSAVVIWAAKYISFVATWQPLFFAGFTIWLLPQMVTMFKSDRKRSESLRLDLNAGAAEIRRFEAVEAIRVEEFEDEGTGFFMKLKDGRTLFVCGQQFYELEDEHKFPCSTFEIAQTPHAKWPLGVTCTGSYFPPSHKRGPFADKDVKAGRVPCDGEIMEVDFESLKSSNSTLLTDAFHSALRAARGAAKRER